MHLGATLSSDGRIDAEHIQLPSQSASAGQAETPVSPGAPLHKMQGLSPVEAAETGYILELLQRFQGSRKQVAANMNISERTLYRKLKRYGLNRPL